MQNAERCMELLELVPHRLDLDSGAVVGQRVAPQDARGLRKLEIKLQQALASSCPSSEPEETAG
jgi:hypothetical protein